jgi:cytochrome oxidase Cu insertion factor (SCO1/SenC/PrrC family)
MLKKTLGTWLILVVLVALVTACSNTTPPPPTAGEERPATEEVMPDKDEAAEEIMADDMTDEEMMDDDKTEEETMADDKADEEMMANEEVDEETMAGDKADEEMMADDTTDEETIADDNADEAVNIPDWFNVELTDVNTGETFRIADFQGKVVLIETMAVWCPTCARQAKEIQTVHEMLGERDDFVSVTLDVDPNETEEILKGYTEQYGFDWKYAVSPHEVNRALGNLYSAQYLNPPVSPLLIIDQQGRAYGLPFGTVKKATNLKPTIEAYLNGG